MGRLDFLAERGLVFVQASRIDLQLCQPHHWDALRRLSERIQAGASDEG